MVLTTRLLQNKYIKYFKFLKKASYIGKKIKTTYTLILVSSIIPHKKKPGFPGKTANSRGKTGRIQRGTWNILIVLKNKETFKDSWIHNKRTQNSVEGDLSGLLVII